MPQHSKVPSFFSCQKQTRTCIGLCLSLHPCSRVNRIYQSSWMFTSNADLYSAKSRHWVWLAEAQLHGSHSFSDRQNQASSSIYRPTCHSAESSPTYPLHPASFWEECDLFSTIVREKHSREGLHVHPLTDVWCVCICVHLLQLITETICMKYKSMFPSEHYKKECLLLKTEIQDKHFWIWWRAMLYLPCICELK